MVSIHSGLPAIIGGQQEIFVKLAVVIGDPSSFSSDFVAERRICWPIFFWIQLLWQWTFCRAARRR